jgi:hypothetical protein
LQDKKVVQSGESATSIISIVLQKGTADVFGAFFACVIFVCLYSCATVYEKIFLPKDYKR